LVDVSQLVLFNEVHEEPEAESARAVHQQLPH
jgi:hypothetical protein